MMETVNTLHSGMCRCCSSEGTFKDIKTKYHWMGDEEVYAEMLTDCFDIKIQTPEDMDNGICEVCITQLRNAVNFKKQVLHTEEQFKKRLRNRDFKNPIKLESLDGPIESDHLSDPDFSGAEFEVTIKEEVEEKPKGKKRQSKPAASRAKKAKADPESSQRVARRTRIITIDATNQNKGVMKLTSSPNVLRLSGVDPDVPHQTSVIKIGSLAKSSIERKRPIIVTTTSLLKKPSTSVTTEQKTTKKLPIQISKASNQMISATEMTKHQNNLDIVLRHSNATPTRGNRGVGYACYYCPLDFPNPADLKVHTLESHKDFKRDPLKRPPKLNSYSVKLDITNLTCKECSKNYALLTDLMDHLRVDHNKPVHTNVKNYLLPFRFDSDPLKCVLCNTEFTAFKMAAEHMNVHYRNYICDVCDAGFVNRANMRTHKSNHQNGECQCPQCHQVFQTVAKLRYHINYTHLGQTKRNKCGYCGEKFSCLVMKNNHLVKAHGVSPTVVKCKACDKTFRSHQGLRVHHKIYHLQIKNFKCTVCEMEFAGSNYLKTHMLKHTGVRDYKCDVCKKSYARKYTLTQHMRIHSDDRSHKCKHCSMLFIQKCSLKSHLLSKHGVEMGK